jgi:2-polyprenyl-6-methoxyphenol hydroxylase-like FAD-dependent oxidoreductase
MWTADDFYSDVTCQIHMDRYFAGRVALVGDAAYCPSPLSGQGTSLALVGAYVLATALLEDPLDVGRAFAHYDARMRPFASRSPSRAETSPRGDG